MSGGDSGRGFGWVVRAVGDLSGSDSGRGFEGLTFATAAWYSFLLLLLLLLLFPSAEVVTGRDSSSSYPPGASDGKEDMVVPSLPPVNTQGSNSKPISKHQ